MKSLGSITFLVALVGGLSGMNGCTTYLGATPDHRGNLYVPYVTGFLFFSTSGVLRCVDEGQVELTCVDFDVNDDGRPPLMNEPLVVRPATAEDMAKPWPRAEGAAVRPPQSEVIAAGADNAASGESRAATEKSCGEACAQLSQRYGSFTSKRVKKNVCLDACGQGSAALIQCAVSARDSSEADACLRQASEATAK